MKIKKGDTVKVIAGKDKDKEGKVLSVDKKTGSVVVEGVNMVTKHAKPSAANQQGGIVNKEAPIDASNVMYVQNGKATQSRLQGRGRQESSCCKKHRRGYRLIREEAKKRE